MTPLANPRAVSPAAPAQINTAYLGAICLVAAMGGLLFGYDWVVIGGAAKFYEAYFHLERTMAAAPVEGSWLARLVASLLSPSGWAQSCALLGCLVGAMVAGPLADRWGRKPLLTAAAVTFVVSSVAIALATSFSAFVAWRILGGVGIGLASSVSPLFISEVAPARHRGLLVSINQFAIVIGVLAAQVVNWRLARPVPAGISPAEFFQTWNVQHGWRWMFAACAAPSVLFLACSLLVPESPRWLARRSRWPEARSILAKIGGDAYADEACRDMAGTAAEETRGARGVDWRNPRLLAVLALGIALAVLQQWCGINVIFNYAGEIFAQAGYNLNDTMTNIVMTGVVNLGFTLAALYAVDRAGRRPLMLGGTLVLAAIYTALGLAYRLRSHGAAVPNALFLVLVLAAIASYAVSLAPVTWVLISEIFPARCRGFAMSVAVGSLWIACFLLTYTFPLFNAALGAAGTFWIYAGICAAGFVLILCAMPETRGKSLEEIERELFRRR